MKAKEKNKKLMTMNLFEIHDYIESVENRVKVLEELVIKDDNRLHFPWEFRHSIDTDKGR